MTSTLSTPPSVWLLRLLAVLLLGGEANAHFIWIHVFERPFAKAEVLFGDGIYQDSDPNLVRYVEGLKIWIPGGTQLEAGVHDWGLAVPLEAGADLVAAERDMGVFDRPGPGPAVKLDYYAKGASTLAAAGRSVGTRAEVLAFEHADELELRVMFDGQPAPGAKVVVAAQAPRLHAEYETDSGGTVRIARPPSGALSIRARVEVASGGELDGSSYTGEHHWATLAVSSVHSSSVDTGPGPAGWHWLEAAHAREARLPSDLVGLAGTLTLNVEGTRKRGEFSVVAGEVTQCELEGADEEELEWLRAELLDLVDDRRAVPFELTTGQHAITLGSRDGHPHGRLIHVANPSQTSYRVLEDQLQSSSWIQGQSYVVELLLDRTETSAGLDLPLHTMRTYFDVKSGVLLSSEARTDTYKEVAGNYLPATRLVVTAGSNGLRVKRLTLRNYELVHASELRD